MSTYNIFFGSVNNDGGVALKAGTPNNEYHTVVRTFSNNRRTEEYPFGSALVEGVNIMGIDSTGLVSVPWSSPRSLVKRATKKIASKNTNIILTSGNYATQSIDTIHENIYARTRLQTTAYRTGYFNNYTGKFAAGYPDNQLDYLGQDNAANLTRKNQGSIIFKNYRNISIVPYQSKTGWQWVK